MLTKISLVVALCSSPSISSVQQKMADLQAKNPDAKISMRVDKNAMCENGKVLTPEAKRLAKALEALK